MPATPSSFTGEQVSAAIRAGYSPRWDTALAPADARRHAANYRANAAHCRRHIRRRRDESDYLQVAEKSWGAFTQTVKAIVAHQEMHITSRIGIMRVARELSDLVARVDPAAGNHLKLAAAYAHSLHLHFYENDLPDAMVAENSAAVVAAVDLLQNLFLPPQSAPEAA